MTSIDLTTKQRAEQRRVNKQRVKDAKAISNDLDDVIERARTMIRRSPVETGEYVALSTKLYELASTGRDLVSICERIVTRDA